MEEHCKPTYYLWHAGLEYLYIRHGGFDLLIEARYLDVGVLLQNAAGNGANDNCAAALQREYVIDGHQKWRCEIPRWIRHIFIQGVE